MRTRITTKIDTFQDSSMKTCNKFKRIDRDRTRTCNPQIRSLVPYPLGHTVSAIGEKQNKGINQCFNQTANLWPHHHTD